MVYLIEENLPIARRLVELACQAPGDEESTFIGSVCAKWG